MRGSKSRPGRVVWSFLLSAAACLASEAAVAQCIFEGTLPQYPTPGEVPCYIVVQPIDVCSSTGSSCAPFNTVNAVGNPSTAGAPFSGGLPVNETSQNPIGFTVDPATGASPPPSGDTNGADITRTLLNELGVDLMWLPMKQYNSDINPNTNTTFQTLNVTQTTVNGVTHFQSSDFQLLSFQNALSQGAQPPDPSFPKKPLATPTTTVNMFFLTTLNPPAQQAGGALYGFSWIGNNGVSIAQNTFGFPKSRSSLPPRPDTIAHELGHNLGLDHTTFGAGPYSPQSSTNPFPPGGITPPVPANPLAQECDPSYPGCPTNLMTTGSLRTAPTVGCVLAGYMGDTVPSTCFTTISGIKTQSPSLYTGTADQVNTPVTTQNFPLLLPKSQQAQVLTGGSGLLFPFTDPPMKSGFLNPIPQETTKAQVETGDSSAASIMFDVTGPAGGRPGETLVSWILTLPEAHTFARDSQFHIVWQSRKGLVQDVSYYPEAGPNPLMRNIAYDPEADKNANNPGAAYSPCTPPTAQCLMVEFQRPGLGPHDSIRFSMNILSGGAPITNDELCKAKITYVFSDGYATTSRLGPCTAVSLPLLSSSWRPDPTVPPRIMTVPPRILKSNVLLAALDSPGTGQVPSIVGYVYLNNSSSTNAVIGFPHGMPDVMFSVPNNNPACTGAFTGGTLCFNSNALSNGYTVGGFLATGNATILAVNTAGALAANLDNTVFEFTGTVSVVNGQTFTLGHDDGLQFMIGSDLVVNAPGPTALMTTRAAYAGPSGTFPFDLVYAECCGPPAILDVSLPLASPIASLPCAADPVTGQCPPLELADANPSEEGGQPGQSCNNGATNGTIEVSGTITGNVTVSAGQQCRFTNPCEIQGNLTINGGSVYLGCALAGNLTDNSGLLVLASSASVGGNVQISQGSAFSFYPGAVIDGNLQIQNLPAGVSQPGTVCGAQVKGNLQVLNNASPVEIGSSSTQNCGGNTISGNLQVNNNTALMEVYYNTVIGNLQCQSNNPIPMSGSNMVRGVVEGQCPASSSGAGAR